MGKQSKFNETFKECEMTSEGWDLWLSRELYSKQEALKKFSEFNPNYKFTLECIKEDQVRFCITAWSEDSRPGWWAGMKGKGSKPIWVIHDIYKYKINHD